MLKDVLYGEAAKEIEILEFKAGGNSYGVEISDVKEILNHNSKPTAIPNAHPYIEGIIKPRDFIISIINLTKGLKLDDVDKDKHDMLIVSGINDMNIAFHVDSVIGIHKIMNKEVQVPGKKVSTALEDAVLGVLTKDGRRIEVIDFRVIIAEINPKLTLK